MKLKDKYIVNPEFEDIFKHESHTDEILHDATILMYKFLNQLQRATGEKPILKKDLASKLKLSRSYVTQLYKGQKLINLLTLAKIQDAYKITFDVSATSTNNGYSTNTDYYDFERPNSDEYWLYVENN